MSTLCTLDLSSSLSPLLLLEVIEKKKCFSVSNTYVLVFGLISDLRRWNVNLKLPKFYLINILK